MSSPARRKKGCGKTWIDHLQIAGSAIGARFVSDAADQTRVSAFDSRRHAHQNRVARRNQSAAFASLARNGDELSGAATARARALDRDRQDSLLIANASAAVACAARFGNVTRCAGGAATIAARDDALVFQLFFAAKCRFLERDLELTFDVTLVTAADSEDAEQVAQKSVDVDVVDVDYAARKRSAARKG